MKQNEDITDNTKTVIFRKHKETREVIALLPRVPSTVTSGECMAFHTREGWGSADYEQSIAATVPAIESEYLPTLQAMGKRGHSLVVSSHEEMTMDFDSAYIPNVQLPVVEVPNPR